MITHANTHFDPGKGQELQKGAEIGDEQILDLFKGPRFAGNLETFGPGDKNCANLETFGPESYKK